MNFDATKIAICNLRALALSSKAIFECSKTRPALRCGRVFDKEKLDALNKSDKSKKGCIDKEIWPLIIKINSLENYYTTSSCSGRIGLLEKRSDKKCETEWLFKSHSIVKFDEIKNALNNLNLSKHDLWFRQEPAIIHVACRAIEDAQKLIDIARITGFKRSGIQATRKRILAEIGSSETIATIIAKGGKLLVEADYLKILIDEANKKLERNKGKLDMVYAILLAHLS